ncbi:MAG: hypothetical protein WA160_14415 [Pseudobdellovibrio sp.]
MKFKFYYSILLITVSFLPSFCWSANRCEDLWSKKSIITATQKTLIDQIRSFERTMSDQDLIRKFIIESEIYFKNNSIDYTFNSAPDPDNSFFIINASNNSELNKSASFLEKEYGVKFFVYPKMLSDLHANGYATAFNDANGTSFPVILIGAESLFSGRRIMRDHTLLHELSHIKTFPIDLNKNKSSPFYGGVFAVEGEIPDNVNPHSQTYRDSLSFDEIKTYALESRIGFLDIKRSIKKKDKILFIESIADTKNSLSNAWLVSYRTAYLIEELLKKITESSDHVQFSKVENILSAKINNIQLENSLLEFDIPIVLKAVTENPLINLTNQLTTLLATARLTTDRSDKAFQILKLLDNDTLSDADKLNIISTLNIAFPMLRN